MDKILSTMPLAKHRKPPFRYCVRYPATRHKERFYVRIKGHLQYRMRSEPWDDDGNITQAFTNEYHEAVARIRAGKEIAPHPNRIQEGSVRWLVERYYQSKIFRCSSPLTKLDKQSVLNRYCDAVGDFPFKQLRKQDVEASQMKRQATPSAANKLVKYLKTLFNWAIAEGIATANPASGVTKLKVAKDGYSTWSQEEISRFRETYPRGTMARLAFELMFNTGARRSDVIRLGPENIIDGNIHFCPLKGASLKDNRELIIPIMEELAKALEACGPFGKTLLQTEAGEPFTVNGFGNRMRKWCDAANLPDCSAHGIRKASATQLAEAGVTEAQLMAVFGWSDPKEARRYTEKARQIILAKGAMDKLPAYKDPSGPDDNL